jgi:CII-binding regulator of phage lambda lysogenization HflD
MARLKRSSPILDKADRRIAGIKSIGTKPVLGSNLSIPAYADSIQLVRQRLEAYNSALSTVDAAQQALEQAEKELAALSKKMLSAIAFNYGDDSTEYSMAGGVRTSDRKKPTRTKTAEKKEMVKA